MVEKDAMEVDDNAAASNEVGADEVAVASGEMKETSTLAGAENVAKKEDGGSSPPPASTKKKKSPGNNGRKADEKKEGKEAAAPALKTVTIKDLLTDKKYCKKLERVCYFHHEDMAIFDHPASHLARPFRAAMAHEILASSGVYGKYLDPIRPRLATRTDIGQYHSDNYVATLQTADDFLKTWPQDVAQQAARNYVGLGRESTNGSSAQRKSNQKGKRKREEKFQFFSDGKSKIEKYLKRFNLCIPNPEWFAQTPCPLFPGLYDYCRMYASGSLGCAQRINSKLTRIAVNWYGGMHHARSSYASGGCYVNDCVLAILELLKHHHRVLYVDLDRTHGDAVEEAFLTTDRVATLSLHSCPSRGEWPCTGSVEDIGIQAGEGFAVNVPLLSGTDDSTFSSAFKKVLMKAKKVYAPDAVVVQCGGGALAGEKLSDFNVTLSGYGACVKQLRNLGLPLLALGGGGTNLANVSRLWAYLTLVLMGCNADPADAHLEITIPEECKYRDYYGPTHLLNVLPSTQDNSNDEAVMKKTLKSALAAMGKASKAAVS